MTDDSMMTADQSDTVASLRRWLREQEDEIERLREECAALRDEVELKQAALTGTSRMMGEEIERLRALLREYSRLVSRLTYPEGEKQFVAEWQERVREALGE